MEIKAVSVQRLYLQVAEQLSQLIRKGALKPGSRLPSERSLAEQFGVSRPTIREAMIALEIADMVEIRSGSGVYVLPQAAPQPEHLHDEGPGPLEVLEARYHIESEAAALAAERITEEELSAMQQALDDMKAENRLGKVTEKADEQFHLTIAAASRNSALHATIRWLWELRNQTEISSFFHQKLRKEGSKPVIRDHSAIFNAIKKKDPKAARRAMQRHLRRILDVVSSHSKEESAA